MRITDAFYSIPLTLFAMVILTIMDPGVLTLVFVIGVTNWPFYARMVRSEVLGLKNKEYIKAARTIGTSGKMIMLRHILPNILPTFIVVSTLSVASSILIEASLSFLGLGIQPPAVSWGVMLSDGRNYLATNWWMATFPGIAISLTVLGIMLQLAAGRAGPEEPGPALKGGVCIWNRMRQKPKAMFCWMLKT